MTTGERLKYRRKEIGLSAEKVAERLGVSPATIYRYEKGDIEKVPVDSLAALAKILHTTPAYLMGWEDAPTTTKPAPVPPGFIPKPNMNKVPLIGAIACGDPITAMENREGSMDVPEDICCDFALRCHGDSMINAGIHDGDVVYIKIQPEVETGEIAAVRIGDEATLKRVYLHSDYIELRPENPAYESIIRRKEEMNDVVIEGKAVGWTHWV